MIKLSEEIEREIERRVADGEFHSADDLVRRAILALDGGEAVGPWLEEELLKGLVGEDTEVTSAEMDAVWSEALANVHNKSAGG